MMVPRVTVSGAAMVRNCVCPASNCSMFWPFGPSPARIVGCEAARPVSAMLVP